MRILFIHTKYKERGGEDSVVESEIQLLRQNGHAVEALYFDNSNHNLLNLLLLPFNFISYFKTLKEAKHFQPDIAHLHNLHFAASASVIYALKRRKIPMVKTLHNYRMLCPSGTLFHNNEMYLKSLTTSFPWNAVKEKIYRNSRVLTFWLAFTLWIHKSLGTFRKIDRYITLNEKARAIFLQSGLRLSNQQVITKPNFIWQQPDSASATRSNQFLYVGRLSPEKGISVLLKAFAGNGLPLVIIGDGPMRDEVIRNTKEHQNITWLGFQKKEAIAMEMSRCSALVVPSVCLEGMPLTIVEGFALATPVIASRLGAMEAIVTDGKNGLHFTANDADSLTSQLYKWESFSSEKKRDFSHNALRTYKEKYTPMKNLSVTMSIYRELLSKEKKPQKMHRTKQSARALLKHHA